LRAEMIFGSFFFRHDASSSTLLVKSNSMRGITNHRYSSSFSKTTVRIP
jgi:hypothetical protein